jgi:hypothetical protein
MADEKTEDKPDVDEAPKVRRATTQKTAAEKGEEIVAGQEEFNKQRKTAPDGEKDEQASRSKELEGETVSPEEDSLSTITRATDRTADGYAPQPVAPPVGTKQSELDEGYEWVLPSHLREPVKVVSKRF